jgi:heme/copper-type cytochrome/quinol oxidase subunit 2
MKDLSATGPINMMTSSFNGYLLNPIILSIIFLSILFIFIFKFATLGSGDTDGYNKTTKILAIVICAILISLLGANAFQYFFGIDVSTYVTGLFTPTPKVEVVVDQSGAVNNSIP